MSGRGVLGREEDVVSIARVTSAAKLLRRTAIRRRFAVGSAESKLKPL